MQDKRLQRADLLLEQGRVELALREFGQVSAESPDNAEAHRGLAYCHARLGDLAAAEASAARAIEAEPDAAQSHITMAMVLYFCQRFDEAHISANLAIRLDPFFAGAHRFSAEIYLAERRWHEAEQAAERGLEIDPGDESLLSTLGIALQRQGKHEASFEQLQESLSQNPENPDALALLGWGYLQQGDDKRALETFQQSLRLEPGNDSARDGLAEALKSHFAIYRWLLKWFFWMDRFSGKTQFAVIIGLFIGMRVLSYLADTIPILSFFIYPLIVAYMCFALFTWWGEAIFNLLLRSSQYGRHALRDEQITHSNWMALMFGLMICGALVWLAGVLVNYDQLAMTGASFMVVVGVVSLPLSVLPKCQRGWPGNTALGLSAGFGFLAVVHIISGIGFMIASDRLLAGLFGIAYVTTFLLSAAGGFITQFLLGMLVKARPHRKQLSS